MSNKSVSNPQPLVVGSPIIGAPALASPGEIIQLAERASEIIEITELEPDNDAFIGKHINRDGSITPYPKNIAWWRQRVVQVPATIPHLFAYLREARTRNICLIRGASANLERQPTRRRKAGVVGSKDRGDHGFVDEPTKLFFLDVDGIKMQWRSDPEGAIKNIVAQLGEPWASTSYAWFFSTRTGWSVTSTSAGPADQRREGVRAPGVHYRACTERARSGRADQHREGARSCARPVDLLHRATKLHQAAALG